MLLALVNTLVVHPYYWRRFLISIHRAYSDKSDVIWEYNIFLIPGDLQKILSDQKGQAQLLR
jgi:hypothetical protein